MQVWSLLHPRCSYQFNIAGASCVGGFVGAANSASGRAALRIRRSRTSPTFPSAMAFQALVLSLCNEHCQFLRLKIETRIDYLHTAGKDAMFLVESKKPRPNRFRCRRLIDCLCSALEPNKFVPVDLSSFFLSVFFAWSFAGFSAFLAGAGEPAAAAAICPADRAPIAHAINKANTRNFLIRSCWVLRSDEICQ